MKTKLALAVIILSAIVTSGYAAGSIKLVTGGCQWGEIDIDVLYLSKTQSFADAVRIQGENCTDYTIGQRGGRYNSVNGWVHLQFGCTSYAPYSPSAGYVEWDVDLTGAWWLCMRYSKNSAEGNPIELQINDRQVTDWYAENQGSWERFDTIVWTLVDFGEDPFLSVSPSIREVSAEAGTTSFSVSSNVEWSASENSSWLTTTRDGSSILVNYEANNALESRQTIITIEGEDLSEEVRITQAGEAAFLSVSPSIREVSAEAGTTSFSVSSNVEWSASENSSWLTTTRDGSSILVNYEANNALESRQTIITIEGEDLSEEVRITQAGEAAFLSVSPSIREVSAEAGTTSFSVSSNVEWSASENSSWLTTTRDGSSILVNYEANNALESRQTIITFDGGDLSEEVRITQAGEAAFLSVSPSIREVSAEAGTTSFSVSSNVEWSASENSSWLTTTRDGSSILVNYEANNALESRQTIITIEGEDLSEEVRITQAGEAAFLSVSPATREVSVEAGTTSFSVSSNVEWSASENSSWLTTTRDGSSILVNYDANNALESRQTIITFDGGDLSEEVRITQVGRNMQYDTLELYSAGYRYGTINVGYIVLSEFNDRNNGITIKGYEPFDYSVGEIAYRSGAETSVDHKIFNNLGCTNYAPWSAKSGSVYYLLPKLDPDKTYFYSIYYSQNVSPSPIELIVNGKLHSVFNGFNGYDWNFFRWSTWYLLDSEYPEQNHSANKATSTENHNMGVGNAKVYPNPVHNLLTMEFDPTQHNELKIIISDLLGKVIETRTTERVFSGSVCQEVFDFSSYHTGVYLYQVVSNTNELLFRGKIVKQ